MKRTHRKVALISHWSSQGGAERFLYDAARCFRQAGIEVVAFFPHRGSMTRKYEALGVDVHTSSYRWWAGKDVHLLKRIGRNLWTLACLPRIAWIIAKSRCDVVYTNTSMVWIGAASAKLLGLPHVWHVHEYGWDTFDFTWDLGKRLSLWWIRSSSRVVLFNSGTTAKKYREYGARWTERILHQGFEPIAPEEDPMVADANELRLGVVGFVNEQKRQLDAIRALAILAERGIPVTLTIIGHCETAYAQTLLEHAEAWGVRDRIRLRGFIDSAEAIYGSFDILVVPSLSESFGRVTVEAMLSRKAVVAADSGANAELIRDQETGFLYRGGDSDHLAQVLQRVLRDEGLRHRVMEVAYAEARHSFSMEAMQRQLVELMEELGT